MVSDTSQSAGKALAHDLVSTEIGLLNSQRVVRFLPILGLVHVVHVIAFLPYIPGAVGPSELWRNGVILAHGAMLPLLAAVGAAQYLLNRRCNHAPMWREIVIGVVSQTYLVLGAVLSVIDQQVGASITALLITTTGTAAAILIRPTVAVIQYGIAVGLFLIGTSWTQPNADLLLSVRVNGIAATALGLGLVLVQWRNQVRVMEQQQRIEEQQRELEAKNQELTLLATRDVMTGLLNRAHFLEEVHREVARMERSRATACLIMIDIDHFKRINDSLGHPGGDRVLIGVAHALAQKVRTVDLLARFGGEEFAILLPETDLAEGMQVAERLRVAIAEAPVAGVPVTLSLGVAELSFRSPDAFEQCYRAADTALYQAKEDGRNLVRFAGELTPTDD